MKPSGVEDRALAVSTVTGVSTVLSVIFQLASVPICLHFWGKELYGQWMAVFAAATIFRTVDGGFITFIGNKLNILFHDDQAKLRRTLASSIIGVVLLGIAQIGLVVLALWIGGFDWLFGSSGSEAITSAPTAVFVLVCVWVFSGSYIGILHRLLIPTGLMYQAAWWSMGYQASVFIGIIAAATLGLTLVGASILMALVQASVYLSSAIYIRWRLPQFYPWLGKPDWRMGISDLGKSATFMISGALEQASTSGMVLFVTGAFGAAALPAFTTIRTVVNLWRKVTDTLTYPLLPDVIRYHVTQQKAKLTMIVEAHAWLLGTVVNIGAVASYPALAWIYGYWTGGELRLDNHVAAWLFVGILFLNASALMTLYVTGTNNALAVLSVSFVRAVLSLGVAALFVGRGIASAGVGIATAEVACFVLTAGLFFPLSLRRAGSGPDARRSPWPFVSLAAGTLFFVALGVNGQVDPAAFAASLATMLFCTWMGWRRLDGEVRHRLLGLGQRLILRR